MNLSRFPRHWYTQGGSYPENVGPNVLRVSKHAGLKLWKQQNRELSGEGFNVIGGLNFTVLVDAVANHGN